MPEFSIGDAALAGPRLIGSRPRILLYWIGLSLIVTIGSCMIAVALFLEPIRQLVEMGVRGEELTLQMILPLLPRLAMMVLIFGPVALVYQSVIRMGATRGILRPADDRFGYLRFGPDELRGMAVVFVIGCIRILARLATAIALGIIVGLWFHHASDREGLVNFLTLPVVIFVFLKFVLAVPETLDTGQISIFGGWTLSNGRTWRMFLVYCVVVLIAFGAALIVGAISFGAIAGVNLAHLRGVFQTDQAAGVREVFNLITPVLLVVAAISGLVSPFFNLLFYCPAAHIYRAITSATEERAFE